jgi:hypothetical protein
VVKVPTDAAVLEIPFGPGLMMAAGVILPSVTVPEIVPVPPKVVPLPLTVMLLVPVPEPLLLLTNSVPPPVTLVDPE